MSTAFRIAARPDHTCRCPKFSLAFYPSISRPVDSRQLFSSPKKLPKITSSFLGGFLMLGLMMKTPLLLSSILTHAAHALRDVEIVSRSPDSDRTTAPTYTGLLQAQLVNWPTRLSRSGVKPGDRLATLAWNGYRHLELYYGISGHWRGLPHRQSAAVRRPDRLHHQSRRGPLHLFRCQSFVDLVKQLMPQCPIVEQLDPISATPQQAKAAGIDRLACL